ncbi:hypothetical protein C8R43DRAFT_1088243 [Mycena crocata]|nr:hypothetical protein C8R43DRAFT_1088243 [Mycena crocata]
MSSLLGLVHRLRTPPADGKVLKFGVLGAAAIAPGDLIGPAKMTSRARNKNRAAAYAKEHGIEKVFGSYQELLDDPEIDVVYNPALTAGKHVLLEKSAASTAEEIGRFHPSGELGTVRTVSIWLTLPRGKIKSGDIRFDYSLGGGALMDMGYHTTSATFALSGSATGTVLCDLAVPPTLGLIPSIPDLGAVIQCENGELRIFNYMMPALSHSITVAPTGRKSSVEKAYTLPDIGEPESTYRYQLEAFVNKVKGRTPHTWITRSRT